MRQKLLSLVLETILRYHRLLRRLSRWLWALTLPPSATAQLYRRLYVKQFEREESYGRK